LERKSASFQLNFLNLVKGSHIGKSTYKGLKFLCASICIAALCSCQKEKKELPTISAPQSKAIQRLELKVERLENILKERERMPTKARERGVPPGKIKSLTFRTGTEDDRLRIYWEDGSKSDLPCMKEQFIWACG